MADDSRDLPAASAPREELIAAYKRLLQTYLDRRPSGLPLFQSMVLLGRDRTLARLRAARERLTG